ncbi:MAG: glycosyltransferase [Flavobacteriaceae bacterium]|nr:glycosyltransferase [Flavobacteriaceae bacterium]
MSSKIVLLKSNIHNLTMAETLALIETAILQKKQLHHVVVNAGKLVAMQNDDELRKSVNSADIINADGQAVVWASKLLDRPLKERVAGIDLMQEVVAMAHQKNFKIFLFGAREEVVSKVSQKYTSSYGPNLIAGYRNGYFDASDESEIAREISESGANILFVAISSPIKENFLFRHRELLKNVNFIMGVGGSFDVIAGVTKRAPLWMQKVGMEWFYRFMQEPRRMWKRYLFGNSKFMLLVMREWWGDKVRR